MQATRAILLFFCFLNELICHQMIQYPGEFLLSRRHSFNNSESINFLKSTSIDILKHQTKVKPRGKHNKCTLLTIINWNVEGIDNFLRNSPDINPFRNADLIFLTETLSVAEEPTHIPGYYGISSPAQKHDQGRPVNGISIYAKPFLSIELINKSNNKVHINSSIGECICYYHNPNTNIEDIIQEITDDVFNTSNHTCIIAGDFNCRIDKDFEKGNLLLQLMTSLGFQLCNMTTEPTYITHNGGSCIPYFHQIKKPKNS